MNLDPRAEMLSDLNKAADSLEDTDTEVEEMPEEAPEQESAAAAGGEPAGEPVEGAEGEPEEPKPSRARDEGGRFSKKPTAAAAAPQEVAKPPAKVVPQPGQEQPAVDPAAVVPKPSTYRPPQSWKPTAQALWQSIPPEAQAEISKREREVAVALQQTAEKSKSQEALETTISPFRQHILAQGGDVNSTVHSLLATSYQLHTAPLPHRARMIAGMISNFLPGQQGIDLLADALEGKAVTAQPQQHQVDPAAIEQRVIQNVMRTFQQQSQQRVAAEGQRTVAEFAEKAEFFEHVRPLTRAIMLAAAEEGLPKTLEQAYNEACRIHPEVSKYLEQRGEAERAKAKSVSTQRSRNAASSIRTEPTGNAGAQRPDTWLGALEENLEKLSGR